VNDANHTNSQDVRDGGYVARPAGPWPNESLPSDPIGADVGPLPPIDGGSGDPADKDGAIDGLPGRYERQAEEDDEVGLDLTHAPLGATNG
jgi:hypothetical protein